MNRYRWLEIRQRYISAAAFAIRWPCEAGQAEPPAENRLDKYSFIV
jgi:hypothetical protein